MSAASSSPVPPVDASPRGGVVRSIPFVGSDAALVEGIRAGQVSARAALFDRHAAHVQRVLARVLGHDPDLADLVQDVFVRAFAGIDALEDPAVLRGWLTSIAVFTARGCIRRRTVRRWLGLLPAREEPPEVAAVTPTEDVSAALRATYAVLARLPADERIAFALRFVDGMELTDVARAAGTSLATIKRRLARAEQRFLALARREPALREWIEGGARWAQDPT